ncbi:MAG TPA: hydroxysqualene dehydroxylase HpnE [Gemmatimonadaceae bacterium]|nr:hydroxysqualene dehydroxylase HpnE [Gemmatimonadaceae bacterium]
MAARVAVVGAGLAGLAAAEQLQREGFAVELFERSRLLGGRATSFELNGVEVDNGQHVFLGCCSELLGFIDRAGMRASVHLQDRFDALVLSRRDGASRLRAARLPAPWHLVASFAQYRHLGWIAKARIARALAAAKSAQRSTETFADWLSRHGQTRETVRAFWDPFFVPALNAPLDQVSAADAGFVITTAFLSSADAARFGYSTVPLARIAAAAAERIGAVHLGAPVLCIDIDANARHVQALVTGGGERTPFDGVVAALTPTQLTRLLGEPERYGVTGLDAYEPHAIIDVHLWHDRGPLGFAFAALLDSPVQWVFEKGEGYLCCSLSAADDLVGESADTLVQRCWSEVTAIVPGLAGARLERGSVTRVRDATFVAKPGAARPGPATGVSNLAIAGAWTNTGWPDTMESAVRSGRAAARHLAGALGGSPHA